MATPNRTVGSNVPLSGQSTSHRTGMSATVHHLAQPGAVKTTATPFANLQQGIIAMQSSLQKTTTTGGVVTVRPSTQSTSTGTKLVSSTSVSPRKRVRLEEVQPANEEIAAKRKLVLDERAVQMREIKENYIDHLTECFFLQNGGQLMEYFPWRRRPTPQLIDFLKTGKLDSDDEDENPLIYLMEKKSGEELKGLGSAGASTTTPVATSTTLPASVAALSQQGPDTTRAPGGRHGMVFGHGQHLAQSIALPTVMSVQPTQASGLLPSGRTVSIATTTVTTVSAMSQRLAGHMHKSASDSRLVTTTAQSTKIISSPSQSNLLKKSPPSSPGRHRQSSDGTNIKGISSQEAIVERAKQEAQVMSRVAELRKDGLWSSRRLPKVQEPPRTKAHWDYLLEEMQWLAADFLQERKWKKTCARKIAKMVQKHFQDLEQKELRAEREESMKLKRIAAQLGKMVKEFWTNIEKVVQYKQTSRLDEKRKKAMDLHLNFIVDQTEKYSNWLSEGLAQNQGSRNTTPASSVAGDDEFKPDESESDDEETIAKDEEGIDEDETKDELEALQKESEMPIEKILESLPKEIIEKPASIHSDSEEEETSKKEKDEEFDADKEEEEDVEETIEEQEKQEKEKDVKQEINDLMEEGEMDIEELRAKYARAYEEDFEMPVDSDEESTDIDASEDEEESESEEEEPEEEDVDIEGGEDVGLEALVEAETKEKQETTKEEGPSQELTDIAAQALSLQPKGYTLQTTEVKTQVPFLLKHTLREYQHVGLEWLATMYEKRLNGILADEMGLGKTIQTIALLAHLACEKGIWGPHLIVVPTSVMLNWEMELKKWCPGFKILTYYGSQKERKQKRTGWTATNAFHICITSYKLVIQDHLAFRRKKWKYLILDEAQNIKNFKSQRWQCLLNFNSMRRLLLTGTPLQNSLMELWSLMHFLMPNVFQSHKDFKEWFANPLTGMIEGSHEYNESLIRRLHKVLRPFLLRRLKDDVEKQMPKKYEHIVMCHLSKRQRFLYDEFMAQGKTKETLASGHFMSVINILMQLRKVCNHPSLFDPRPIVSPLQIEGVVYNTASLVLKVLEYNPLENIDLHRYPGLAEMERDLPAFIAHRVRNLQTPRRLIEEIDLQPPPPPRPPVGKLKTSGLRCVSPAIQSGRASPAVHSRSVSPSPVIKPVSSTTSGSGMLTPGTTPQPPLQAAVAPQANTQVTTGVQQPASSQPITVQIQHTDQGTRLVVPSGQLPGFIQIVQTSTGLTTTATSVQPSTTVALSSTVVNGSSVTTVASSTVKTVPSVSTQVKMTPSQQSVQLPAGATVVQGQKPVMRVSPLVDGQKHLNGDGSVFTEASATSTTSSVSCTSKPVPTARSSQLLKHWEQEKKNRKKSKFFLESLCDKQHSRRLSKLDFISLMNKRHCEVKPVYGQDLCEAIDIFKDPYSSKSYRNRDRSLWHGPGYIHCHCSKFCSNVHHPKYLWNQTKVLSDIIHSPEQYLSELKDVLERFVFVTPPVQSPRIQMHVSHPPSSYLRNESYREHLIRQEVSPRARQYHTISTKMTVQFPELRLIQYDCGKLQTLDLLLRRLKSGDHRVLIFTQMTRMLDILEAFLNYHGHIYLRLDGTTRVEQRQLLMDRFNADRRIFVFILSTRSGGIGVNLTGADTVIFYDSDWNPTMDAQAQDRCHRIGQTRDVHIYRLVSERTVEENILKKANQKRMLGDMAIEGGNFTTAFFKQDTISELFVEPSGLESLVKEKEQEEKVKQEQKQVKKKPVKKSDPSETSALLQFEKALAKTEDETDVKAIEQVKAEQKAELAEFDENIPWDEREAEKRDEESHVEMELANLDKELSPIERYAVQLMELQMEPVNTEELMIAEEDIENAKKDWELNRLKALKEEEERKAELEEDEMLYTYSRDDAYQQVKKRNRMMAVEVKKAAEAKAAAQSPSRKGRLVGDPSEEEKKTAWVYKTPKLIRDIINKKVDPGDSEGKGSGKKGKVRIRIGTEEDMEEVDVETVSIVDELNDSKNKVKKKLVVSKIKKEKKVKPEKIDKKPTEKPKKARKSKGDGKIVIVKESPIQRSGIVVSTEATRLETLPGFSKIGINSLAPSQMTPTKVNREGLHTPVKSAPDRANIFEQFGVQSPTHTLNVPQSPVLEGTLGGNTVRLVNTAQGRQMVMVSSSPSALQQQNVVFVQGMQGFPQGLVVGNNVVSLQTSPINMATLQNSALVGTPQVLNPRIGARIVTPVQMNQMQQNPTFVQRLVTANPNVQNISGLSVNQLSGIPIANVQLNAVASQLRAQTPVLHATGNQTITIQGSQVVGQQIASPRQAAPVIVQGSTTTPVQSMVRTQSASKTIVSPSHGASQSPVVQTALQNAPIQIQPATAHRKASGQTIANLIASGKAKIAPTGSQAVTIKPGVAQQGSNMPDLSSLMKAQGTSSRSNVSTNIKTASQGQVKVNPAVAKLVASHIQAVQLSSTQTTTASTPKSQGSAIINLGTTSRSSSPTIVKLVSASNLRPGSPVTVMGSKGQVMKAQVATPTLQRGENPVATINIKGLPPGVSIPASLVNSLVSGSISKAGVNVLRGAAPASGHVVNKSIRLANTNNSATSTAGSNGTLGLNHVHGGGTVATTLTTIPTPVLTATKTSTPVGSPIQSPKPIKPQTSSPATPQAWSNPNLVIRTRRAVKEGKSPQILTHRKEAHPVQLPTPTAISNILTNHVSTTNVQVFISDIDQEKMPMWSPPTPPHDDNDVYIDQTMFFLYEPTVMPETQLPPVYVRKEKKKIKIESITTRKQKQRKEEQPRVPRSLFDRPTAQLLKLRREAKIQKLKLGQMKPYRPMPSMPPKPVMEQTPDHPEWLIHEDWALLQAVQTFFDVPLNLMIVNPAHLPNWDMVADVVNSVSRVYRSPKQCRARYENVIIPREEGRIMYDINPRKQKKQKGIYKMAKSTRAMKTSQIHSQDSNNGITILYSLRFDSVKSIATKRPPTIRQTLASPMVKNPKHASVLQENNISYDQPLNPMQVAEIRAQRIQREKKQNQQQQQQQQSTTQASTDQQATVAVTAAVGIQRAQTNVAQAQITAPTIVAMTTAITATQLATIGTAASSATVLTVTGAPGTPLPQATIRQRTPLEISTGATVVGQVTGVSQVRAQLQTTTAATSLTPAQLTQRITTATTLASGATVQQQLQAAGKAQLTPQQLQLFQQQTLLTQRKQQQVLQQQQQLRMQKLNLTDPLRQQPLRQLKGPLIQGPKTMIAQQLVTSMAQGQLKTPAGTTLTRPLTQEELARFGKQQKVGQAVAGTSVAQIHNPQTGQLQSTQIIAGTPIQQVGQALSKVTGQQAGATLVKTVPAGVPVSNVSINVSMPQKAGVAKVSQINPQQMHLLQQRKPTIPVQKGIGQKVNAAPMLNAVQIIQQQGGRGMTLQQLHQIIKQPQGATIQQIIHTSQPTIIATVTQTQATPQMVTKVIATTATAGQTQLQTIPTSAVTISGAVSTSGSPVVTLSQVPVPSLNITSIAQSQSPVTANIVKPGISGESVTTVQIHPITSITQSKLAGVAQNVVVQPIQSVQHVTMAAVTGSQQVHVPVAAQQVTVTAPVVSSQSLQVTVPTTTIVQSPVQHGTIPHTPPAHVTVTAQRGSSQSPAPHTVTVTPTHTSASPIQTLTPGTTSSLSAAVAVATIPTQHTQASIVQAGADQLAQQTVTTILQPQRQATQPTVQVHHTASPSQQPQTQTIHIQSPNVTQQTALGQASTTVQIQAGTLAQAGQQGKGTPYTMRTRNQSKPQ